VFADTRSELSGKRNSPHLVGIATLCDIPELVFHNSFFFFLVALRPNRGTHLGPVKALQGVRHKMLHCQGRLLDSPKLCPKPWVLRVSKPRTVTCPVA
jgi:hypothetical protein